MESYSSALNRSQSMTSGLEKAPPSWNKPCHSRSSSTASSPQSRQNIKDWEVMDELPMEVQTGSDKPPDMTVPGICEGYMLKRRKWPLKGWHKRYFVLEAGILRYSKNQQDISRGRIQGSLDVSVAVMSMNKKTYRIDLDTGDILYHVKAKSHELFYIWVTKLQAHRLYKKNEGLGHNGYLQAGTPAGLAQQNGDLPLYPHYQSSPGLYSGPAARPSEGPHAARASEGPEGASTEANGKVSAWLQQSQDPDSCVAELNRCQLDVSELSRLAERLQALENRKPISNGELQRIISIQNLCLEKPKKSKSCRVWGHSRTLSRVEALGMPIRGITKSLSSSHLSTSSVASIPDYVCSQLSPPSGESNESRKTQQDFCTVSLRVLASLKTVHDALAAERQRLQEAWGPNAPPEVAGGRPSRGPPSLSDSVEEFFDASDDVQRASWSEASDESGLSEGTTSNSEPDEGRASETVKYRASLSQTPGTLVPKTTGGRRSVLPAHCPDNSHVGLMAILYNNIGKDLSRVSMPAPLNEPINLLQRLCEELEYSELLDTASRTADPYQRMVYVAAFAISGYSSAIFRNRYKPFNPVLGETYECVREDRGFRMISEQVSHHPPISACHAESDNFSFWQDQRWKNKFWGKSLEIVPTGMVNLKIPSYGDHYEWNKVVTCIHNVLSQQRYLEHYGEVTITNLSSPACTCRITFVKARYWGSETTKNEVQGTVLDQGGSIIHRFGGLWHEGIYCDTLPTPKCIWKPNPQPKDHLLYYGFSLFAIELNELTPELKTLLPPTDSRLRPDQRMLEDGMVEESDKKKDELEEMQRERRRQMTKRGEEHIPRFFKQGRDAAGRDVWETNGSYWKLREKPGFANVERMSLW
ncbi:oxysterol-binding protein-related protein 7 [Gadus morhua]|uniref:oxysterol-binding protein-related protein 7 n=1 Tax=Gadus morhua TaxID=8049 RepID=UPI0011B5DD9F|nr:oxysterol-binding protein-related protein 6-like [Gadus morhua]